MTKVEFEDLSEWAWAIRELPSSIEAIYIDKDLILAGDKDGNIVCWGSDGEPIWKQNVGNRVEEFVLTKRSEPKCRKDEFFLIQCIQDMYIYIYIYVEREIRI